MNFRTPVILLAVVSSPALAQLPVWGQYYSAVRPSRCLAVTYDDALQRTLELDSGPTSRLLLWRWNGTDWAVVPAANPPSIGSEVSACVDAQRGVLVAVIVRNGALETWELANGAWSQVAAGPLPSMLDIRLHYVPSRAVVLLIGTQQAAPNDSWIWERGSGSWVLRAFTGAPRFGTINTAYDTRRERLVLFTGGVGGPAAATWEWDGTAWMQRFPRNTPAGRNDSAMAYDSIRGRCVMQSGSTVNPFTWEWDGDNWFLNLTAPPASSAGRMAFDARRGRMVFFGTDTATWEYFVPLPATLTPFGNGCPGTAGVPALAAAPGSLPWLGQTFVARLTNLPIALTALPFGLLGASRSSWFGITLPFDLAVLGAPGCSLLVSADQTFPLANVSGTADWHLAIPNLATLLGSTLFQQALVVDAGANALGLSFSNATIATIGDH